MTRNLLIFARKAQLVPRLINPNAVIVDTNELVRRVLPETVRVHLQLAPDLWSIHADRGSFENALLNLAINARDAMEGSGEITITTENTVLEETCLDAGMEELAPGPYVVVSVSDTGRGIPEDIASEIFVPFFTTKGGSLGNGLGLPMVLGFARQSGGGIRFESKAGVGTTFELYFPASTQAADPDASREPKLVRPSIRGRVLLVEDDAQVNSILARQVEAAGLTCITALDSDEALLCHEHSGPFDLLVTDVVIPGGHNGPSLARHLQQAQPSLKVIFISGYPEDATIHGNEARSEDVRLTKPVSKAELHAALSAVLLGGERSRQ